MNIKLDKIISLRKSKGLSIIKLARLLDITSRTVYNWESGRSYPSKAELMALSHLLNVRLSDISDYKEFPLFYSKPSLQPKNMDFASSEQLRKLIEEYKSIPQFNPFPIIKTANENMRLALENKRQNESIKRLKVILDSLSLIIYIKDEKRIIRYFNKNFLHIVPENFKEENILGSRFSEIFSNGETQEILKAENEVFQTGLPIIDKELNSSFSGGELRLLLSITPLCESENKINEILVSFLPLNSIL